MTPELIAQYRKRYESVDSLEDMGFWEANDVHDDIHNFLNALEAALSQAEVNRVALQKIAAIENEEWGQDWDEIERARAIANESLILTNAVKTKG